MTTNARRDPLALGAVLLTGVAFAGSFVHVQRTVEGHGQAGWLSWAIAAMPELSVLLAVLRVRRDGARQVWPWIVGGTAATFTLSANLAQAEPSVWGWVVAGWPAWAALGAAALVEIGGATPPRSTRPAPPITLTASPGRATTWSPLAPAGDSPLDPLAPIRATAGAIEGLRAVAAARPAPGRATARVETPPRPRPELAPARSSAAPPPWTTRSELGPGPHPGRSRDELLADLRAADRPDERLPSAVQIAAHYRIKNETARFLRDALQTDRSQPGAGTAGKEIT